MADRETLDRVPVPPQAQVMSSRVAVHERGRWALDASSCLRRLSRARSAYLASTHRAMPSVLPVRVQVAHGLLVLGPFPADLADQLGDQVVALGTGRPPGRLRNGWQVVVRGPLSPFGEAAGMLVLDAWELEGTLLHRRGARWLN